MFEDKTYENLMQDALDNAPAGIDKRPGSIFYDAVSGAMIKIAKAYTDIALVAKMTTVSDAAGEALDAKASEYGVIRLSATNAKYYVIFEGVTPLVGERFYTDGKYFTLKENESAGVYYLEAEQAGSGNNNIYINTPAVPVNSIEGLISAKFGAIYENGADAEDDESLRIRVQEKIAGPAENGNKQHYKTWCESIEGIGRARIYPLWNGPNTVKGVLIDAEGKPCGDAKINEVQEYIDPATNGYTTIVDNKTYTVGDGLGEGVANLGAHFTAASASPLYISVTFTAELASGVTKEAAELETYKAIEKHFKELVLNTSDASDIVVRVSEIGAIISSLKNSILDYRNLKLNGAAENISPGDDDVPVIQVVSIE